MLNALAPALNTTLLTSKVNPWIPTSVILETSNVAMSDGPSGTVAGVQFVGLFQLPSASRFHVALPAKTLVAVKSNSIKAGKAAT